MDDLIDLGILIKGIFKSKIITHVYHHVFIITLHHRQLLCIINKFSHFVLNVILR